MAYVVTLMNVLGHTLQIEGSLLLLTVEFELKGIGCDVPQGSGIGLLLLHYTLMSYIELLEKIISVYLKMTWLYFLAFKLNYIDNGNKIEVHQSV